ncbi:MAG: anti-sigma factor RsbA family regulatory protein [Actinomycetes bacterium]
MTENDPTWPEQTGPETSRRPVDGQARGCAPPSAGSGSDAARGAAGSGPTHGAAFVTSEAELLAAALPFLYDGLRSGDLVTLACSPETVELLRRQLGDVGTALVSEPRMTLLGSRAPDALMTCSRYLERAVAEGSGRLRVLAEVDFGSEPADWREGQRFESVFNRLMVGAPVSAICVYDERRLPAPVIASAAATHPAMVRGAAWSASPGFQDPATYLPSLPVPREPVEDRPPVYAVDDAPTLADLRHELGAVIASLVPDRDLQGDLHLGASEIAANAFRHGVRPVSARVWAEVDRLICLIRDRGTSYRDPFAGFTPAHGPDLAAGGMGLWLARKLWDHVDVLPTDTGLTVRLSTRIR